MYSGFRNLISFNFCVGNASAQEQLPLDENAKQVFSQFDEKEIISSSEYARAARRVEFKRGGSLAWSKNIIDWAYSRGKVTKNTAMQEAGFIFPNVVKKKESQKLHPHQRNIETSLGAGVVTTWGDVQVSYKDYTDYFSVNGNGAYSWD